MPDHFDDQLAPVPALMAAGVTASTMMRVRKIAADHHSSQARGRFLPRVAASRDPAGAKHSRASAKGKDLVERIGPLWGEKDEAKRIAGWKAVDKYIAEEGEVIPLFQYVQPIIHKKGLKVVAQSNGMILPQLITSA